MEINEKRQLLIDIETAIKYPRKLDEDAVPRLLNGLASLFGSLMGAPSAKLTLTINKEDAERLAKGL